MSPQPAATANAPAQPDAAKAAPKPVPHAELLKRITDKGEGDRTAAERQILRAQQLEKDRADLMVKVGANREYLRLMGKNEELTDAEAAWLADFYPDKEKGDRRSADEIERTRLVKEAARSNGK